MKQCILIKSIVFVWLVIRVYSSNVMTWYFVSDLNIQFLCLASNKKELMKPMSRCSEEKIDRVKTFAISYFNQLKCYLSQLSCLW